MSPVSSAQIERHYQGRIEEPQAMVRLITLLLVITLDPLAVLLKIAAARGD